MTESAERFGVKDIAEHFHCIVVTRSTVDSTAFPHAYKSAILVSMLYPYPVIEPYGSSMF